LKAKRKSAIRTWSEYRLDISRIIDLEAILKQVREERQHVEEAILALKRIQIGGKKRGLPPAWLAAVKAAERRSGEGPGVAGISG
jgi:hypothetical protein